MIISHQHFFNSFIFIFLLSNSLCYSQWEYQLYSSVLNLFDEKVKSNSNKHLYNSIDYQQCKDEMFSSFASTTSEFYTMISNSGKEVFELGGEDECIANGLTYVLIVYMKKAETAHNSSSSAAFKFLGKTNYFFGFCIKNECERFIRNFFDRRHNEIFFNKIRTEDDIEDINAIIISNKGEKTEKENEEEIPNDTVFLIIIIFIGISLGLKILVFFFGLCFQNKETFRKMMKMAYNNTFVVNNDNTNYLMASNANNKSEAATKNKKRLSLNNGNTNDNKNEYALCGLNEGNEDDLGNNDNEYPDLGVGINDDASSTSSSFTISQKSVYSSGPDRHNSFHSVSKGTKSRFRFCSLSFLYTFFSIGSSVRIIFSSSNFIYDDSGLQLINFFRVYSLFWMTYNHNIWALIRIPGRDVNSYSFFKDVLFSLVKYSIFAMEIWISLEGFYFGYKLMSYMKKKYYSNSKSSLFCCICKFYINFLPKFFIFLFTFFMFHYFIRNYRIFFSEQYELGALFSYLEKYIIYCRDCISDPLLILKPFMLSYNDFLNQDIAFNQCFKFIYIFTNEHYCFILSLIIFFLSFKIKSKIFDTIIFLILVGNFVISYFSIKNYTGNYYHFIFFLGETASLKYTHLYFTTYMTGVFIGVACFYYKDAVSNNPIETDVKQYKPFSFFYGLIMKFNHLSTLMHRFIVILSIIIQILLSFSFNIMTMYIPTEKNDKINFKINFWVNLYVIYEKKIFLIVFMIMLLSIITYPKDTLFKYFYSSNIFSALSRVGFCYLCSMDSLVYLFYCFYHVELHFNYQNLFYVTFGLIILLGLMNIGVLILIEIPIRMIIKMIKRKNEQEVTEEE